MTYQSTVLADSPAFLWPLNETAGTTAADATGNGHTGTYSAGCTLNSTPATPMASNAVLLNGTTGHVSSSYNPSLATLSIECWANLDGLTQAGNSRLLADSHTDSDSHGFQLMLDPNPHVWIGSGSATANVNSTAGTMPSTGWAHLVATYDGSTLRLYANAVQVGSTSFSGTVSAGSASGTAAGYGAAYSGDYLNGLIAWAAVYPSALNSTQVTNHYNAGVTAAGAAALSGSGSFGTPLTGAFGGKAAWTGSGALVTPYSTWLVNALSGSGTLTSAATVSGGIAGFAALSGSGTLGALKGVTWAEAAAWSGSGTLGAATVGAQWTGSGTLGIPGFTLGPHAALSGTGALGNLKVLGGLVSASAGISAPAAWPNSSQVAVAAPGSGTWTYLGTIGVVTSLTYSFTCPGGCDSMTCTLMVPAAYRTTAFNPGWSVRITRGGHQVWDGRLDEPVPTAQGWNLTAVGTGNRGTDFLAIYSSTWPASQPDQSVNNAISRGLPWANPGVGTPAGAWYGQAVDSGAQTITALLNLICTRGGLTWYVNSQPGGIPGDDLSVFPLPTVVNRLLVCTQPVPRTLGGDINTIWIRYESAADGTDGSGNSIPAVYGVTSVQNAQSVAAHGVIETFVDLSDVGPQNAAAAAAVGSQILQIYQRASFAGPFTASYGQLLNAGGAPIDPGADQAGTVCRLILTDFGYGGEVTPAPVTFIVGNYSWDDTSQVATLTPYQSVDTSLTGLLSLTNTVLTPIAAAS